MLLYNMFRSTLQSLRCECAGAVAAQSHSPTARWCASRERDHRYSFSVTPTPARLAAIRLYAMLPPEPTVAAMPLLPNGFHAAAANMADTTCIGWLSLSPPPRRPTIREDVVR